MANRLRRLTELSLRFCGNSYSSFSSLPSSTLRVPFNYSRSEQLSGQISSKSDDHDERRVLHELYELLGFSRNAVVSNVHVKDDILARQLESRAVDEFLLPEEKFRGVFLQKLGGKAVIEQALSNVGVELSSDILAKVVGRGNLSGEAMVFFFNWAIKQPMIANDAGIYNIILKSLGRRKFFKCMMEILHEMVERSVKPSLETMSIVMDSFVRARRLKNAIEIFENLEEYGLTRDTEFFNALLDCLCKRSYVGSANSLFNRMSGKIQFSSVTYNIMISGWSKRSDGITEIERILEEMAVCRLQPDSSTFSYLIEGLGRAGRIDDAVKIFDHMKENACVPDTKVYNAMISNYISVRDFDECMKYYRSLLSSSYKPDLDTYATMISASLKVRKVADALQLFDDMLAQGIVPSTGTVTEFIKPLCSYGPPHAAMIIYKKAIKIGCKISVSAYKLLLMRLARFGKCGMLLNTWNEMQKSGHSSDVEVYEYIVDGLCNIGQLENAALVMEEALSKGFCPNRMIYSKLQNKLLASNGVDRAYRLFLKVKHARRHENARLFWRSNGWHF